MSIARASLSVLLAASLAACGSDGTGAPSVGSGGGATGNSCSLADRKAWVLDELEQYYLFPDLLDTSVDPARYGTLQGYIDALVAPARAQGRDRGFTFITSIREENELINSGSSAGFGIRLGYDTANGRVFVLEAFESAPAYPEGIDRGTEILAVNGTSTASLLASGGAAAFSDALGPSEPGVTRSLTIRQPGGEQSSVTVTKTEYALDPISDRYGAQVIDNNGTSVGYINLRTFIVEDAGPQLRDAIDDFRQQGIDEVILDFRYNGGGLVSVAELLGDLLGRDKVGQAFSRTLFRSSLSSNNSTELFESQPQAIAATKIALIGTGSTASASELVGNAFIPYLGNNTALVGSNTFGKPSGQIARDRQICDDRLRVLAFRTVNAANGGDYYNGLASVYPQTCAAPDDFLQPLGSVSEASTATSLTFLRGEPCTAIGSTSIRVQQRRQRGPRIEALQATTPTAAQYQIPGLF
ncbi:S41 family peptidase [Alteriqipengyuania sp. 357]